MSRGSDERERPDGTGPCRRRPVSEQFIELAAQAINHRKRLGVVDSIKYQRLGDEYYYVQELFEQEELTGYLKNMLAAEK